MDYKSFCVENLIRLIGAERSDDALQAFFGQLDLAPFFTVDKEDGADDEYVEFKEQGVGCYFESGTLMSIFLHSAEGGSGYAMYDYPLPLGIRFELSKAGLLNLLGPPDSAGGGHDKFFGNIPDWIKYKKEGYIVHVEFTADSTSIRMVTLMLS